MEMASVAVIATDDRSDSMIDSQSLAAVCPLTTEELLALTKAGDELWPEGLNIEPEGGKERFGVGVF